MEKEICKRQHLSKERIGCVWVFMNMFDFKHSGSNHKLLMDKKRGSKRITGIETTKVEKQLTSDCDCEENEAEMQSVKKLIEEEIDEKKTQQKCDFECRGEGVTKARNRKRRSGTFSKTSEDVNVLIAGDDDHAEKSDDECPQNKVDSINDESEEKFSELIKRLIAQKERETESCNNLVDASPNIDKPTWGDSQRNIIKESSSCTQTIVILKPEPNGFDVSSSSSTPRTDATCNKKSKNGRFGSRFILSRITRRLKSAVGKNPCNAQHDSDLDSDALSSKMSLGEDIETSSRRDVSDGEKANKEESISGSEDKKKKKVCGIYIAAKKHLSEMLAEGDIDVDLSDKEVPRILGKILALPEFSTPESSPRMTSVHDFVGQINEKTKIQQCNSEDYSEILEKAASTSDTEGVSEKTVLDSLSEANSFSIIRKDEYVDEDEHQKILEKVETFDQLPSSPPNSSVRISECQENATDVLGKSSPVSVLEPFFTDDETSPSSSKFSSGTHRMQPLCIRFDEPDSPRTDEKDNDVETTMDDKELTLAYIESVVKSSELNWEELLVRSFYSEQVLEQALMDDMDFVSTKLCNDKNLLFDCINEVVMEFCGQGPWISFVKPKVLFFPEMENAVEVVQEEVYWNLLPLPSPHTLDQIVRKDFARKGNWMDLRFDIGCIGFEAGEIILDELLEEIISNSIDLFQEATKPPCTI